MSDTMKFANIILEGLRRIGVAMAVVAAAVMMPGCSEVRYDGRLEMAAHLANENPDSAMAVLAEINTDELNEANRHLYDLVTIKAKDKAYVEHTSDSLILDVMDYFERNGGRDSLQAEARYYGGRVYADLGDYPTALRYFQSALELLPEGTPYLRLRGNVLSQTGGLLDELRLFDEAIPYIKDAIRIDESTKDTVGECHDLRLLGGIFQRAKKYEEAEQYINQSLLLGQDLPIDFEQASKMSLADIKFKKGDIDSALLLIRDVISTKNPIFKNDALAYAVKIYYYADKPDSAYMYAKELVQTVDISKHDLGYHYLLSKKLRRFSSQETLMEYIINYRRLLEDFYNDNSNQLALMKQSVYNYDKHEKKRVEAELMNARLRMWLLVILLIVLVLVVGILYIKNERNRQKFELHVAIENIKELNQRLLESRVATKTDDKGFDITQPSQEQYYKKEESNVAELRKKLREELVLLSEINSEPSLNSKISESIAYAKLQRYIRQRRHIEDNDMLWNELEKVVVAASPKFIENLRILTGYRLTEIELKTALLVKCHVPPLQMSELFNRTKGTMVSRRESICYKVFDDKLGTAVIDNIIRLL